MATTTTSPLVKAIPKGFRTVTPHLTIRAADKAIAFYKKALGAKELMCILRPDGKVMHAELKIGNSIIFLGEESPERGCPSPLATDTTTVALYLYVKDVDKAFARAMKAGVTVKMPVAHMFWGTGPARSPIPSGTSGPWRPTRKTFPRRTSRGGPAISSSRWPTGPPMPSPLA